MHTIPDSAMDEPWTLPQWTDPKQPPANWPFPTWPPQPIPTREKPG